MVRLSYSGAGEEGVSKGVIRVMSNYSDVGVASVDVEWTVRVLRGGIGYDDELLMFDLRQDSNPITPSEEARTVNFVNFFKVPVMVVGIEVDKECEGRVSVADVDESKSIVGSTVSHEETWPAVVVTVEGTSRVSCGVLLRTNVSDHCIPVFAYDGKVQVTDPSVAKYEAVGAEKAAVKSSPDAEDGAASVSVTAEDDIRSTLWDSVMDGYLKLVYYDYPKKQLPSDTLTPAVLNFGSVSSSALKRKPVVIRNDNPVSVNVTVESARVRGMSVVTGRRAIRVSDVMPIDEGARR